MRIPRILVRFATALLAGVTLAWSAAATAQLHSVSGDFSFAANPNGAWSYGWLDRLGGAFTPYNLPSSHASGSGAILDAWQHDTVQSLGAPSAVNNPTSVTFESGTVFIPGGWAAFHPGMQGQLSSFRFTAPSAGSYRIALDFQGADCCTTSTDVHVWTAGADLFSALIAGNGDATRQSYRDTVFLNAGQIVDIAVGVGSNGDFYFDSTAVRGTIDLLPPPAPPGSLLFNDYQNTRRSPHAGFTGPSEVAWTLPLDGYEPAVGTDGVVYLHGAYGNHTLYAVSPLGRQLWTYSTVAAEAPGGFYRGPGAPTIGPDGTIYVIGGDAQLHAVNHDGTRKWVAPLRTMNSRVFVLPTGRILLTDHTGVEVLDANGQFVSFLDYYRLLDPSYFPGLSFPPGWIVGQPAVSPDGRTYYIQAGRMAVFPALLDLAVEARSVETHELLWRATGFSLTDGTPFAGMGSSPASVVVDDAGNVYAHGCQIEYTGFPVLTNCALRSLDPSGGERWQVATGAAAFSSLLGLTPDNGGVVLQCPNGSPCAENGLTLVNVLDTQTGTMRWSNAGPPAYILPNFGIESAAIDPSGAVYAQWGGSYGSEGVTRLTPATGDRWYDNNRSIGFTFVRIWDAIALGPNRRTYVSAGNLIAYDQTGVAVNTPPVANAGPDQQVVVGMSVALDGTASSDADGNPLTYRWAIDSGPFLGSQQLADAEQSVVRFAPAAAGTYVLSLVVNDGTENSAPDQVNVQAITPQQCVADSAAAAIAAINGAAAADIDAIGHREALVNFVEQALAAAQSANPALALSRFGEALRRTDGCTLRGAPDAGGVELDWLVGCAVANMAYSHIRRAMDCAALPGLAP